MDKCFACGKWGAEAHVDYHHFEGHFCHYECQLAFHEEMASVLPLEARTEKRVKKVVKDTVECSLLGPEEDVACAAEELAKHGKKEAKHQTKKEVRRRVNK